MKKIILSSFLSLLLILSLFASVFAAAPVAMEKQTQLFNPVPNVKEGGTFVLIVQVSNVAYLLDGKGNATPVTDQSQPAMNLKNANWSVVPADGGVYLKTPSGSFVNLTSDGMVLSTTPQLLDIHGSGHLLRVETLDPMPRYLVWKDGKFLSSNLESTATKFMFCQPVTLEKPTEKPLTTICCLTDTHTDYGLQNTQDHLRADVISVAKRVKAEDNPDLILTGGDLTSNNAKSTWTESTFLKVQSAYRKTLSGATKTGYVLYTAGNHDYQAGQSAAEFFNSADYTSIMLEDIGDFTAYKMQSGLKFDNLLCYRYQICGVECLVMNTYYDKATLTSSEISWLRDEMSDIGKKTPTFVVSHYPLSSLGSSERNALIKIFESYPNITYLYGHVHSGTDIVTLRDSAQHIEPHDVNGTALSSTRINNTGYIVSYMGSLGYYKSPNNPKALGFADPVEVQAMLIYVYSDRIVFQMKNYSENPDGVQELAAYTVLRDYVAPSEPHPKKEPQPKTDLPTSTQTVGDVSTVPAETQATPVSTSDYGTKGTSFPVLPVVLGGIGILAIAGVTVFLVLKKKK